MDPGHTVHALYEQHLCSAVGAPKAPLPIAINGQRRQTTGKASLWVVVTLFGKECFKVKTMGLYNSFKVQCWAARLKINLLDDE